MRKIITYCIFSILGISITHSQTHTISGYITDSKTGETLISASVLELNMNKGSVSNSYGFYSITLPAKPSELSFSYVGYKTQKMRLKMEKDTVINIQLQPATELNEIVVTGRHSETGVRGSQIGAIEVPIAQIKSVPTLFGEADVLKALQLLPGVKAGTEGTSGMYVRGGGPDQNLFLLDGVPIYNVNHMAGFFSVFNPDAIKNVTLYKGNFPARFSGRLSSVVDLRMKDGNNKKLHGNVSIGLISSKINLEGPLFSQNTTFNLSARRTYYDILMQPFIKIAAAENDVKGAAFGYYFYDFNLKVAHRFSDKDRLFVSYYSGDDVIYSRFKEGSSSGSDYSSSDWMKLSMKWGNTVSAVRWNHVISNKLFMNSSLTYTRYRYKVGVGAESYYNSPTYKSAMNTDLTYNSGIWDYAAKVDFDYTPNTNHDVKFGMDYVNHSFKPGVQVLKYDESDNNNATKIDTVIGDKNVYSQELVMYIEDNFNIGPFIKANMGLNFSNYYVSGKYYPSIQPRISARLLLNDKMSIKAGYAYMNQYIHLLSNNNISLPTDLWVPVTKRIDPMNSHQVSAGLFYELHNIADLSAEIYYKRMNNLLEYRDGTSFLGSSTGWEDKVAMGKGWSYGLELLAQRTIGKTTGWIGYTLAKADRLFDRPGQELSQSKVFPAKYDRRHDISIVVSHKLSERIDFSATWVYSTGNTATLAMQNYSGGTINNGFHYNYATSLPYINSRNNFRYPDYHRLDLGINFNRQKKHGLRTWNISVYNAYNHQNPFFVYTSEEFNNSGTNSTTKKLKQVSVFTILPSVSYSYKF